MPIHADETPRLEDMAFETLTRPGGWLRHLAVGGVNQTNGRKKPQFQAFFRGAPPPYLRASSKKALTLPVVHGVLPRQRLFAHPRALGHRRRGRMSSASGDVVPDVASAAFERSHIKTRECAIEELLSAAEAGDLETIGTILDGKMFIDVNAEQWSPRRLALDAQEHWPRWSAEAGYSALHCAAAAGHASVCARLIERGAQPHSTSRRGATPLMLACYGGHLETVECLLAYLRDDTVTPCTIDAPESCGTALDAMMHGVIADGARGPSALHLACACTSDPQRSAAVVAALLCAGGAAHPAGVLRTLPPASS